jgi:hypothetical protein
VLNDPLATEILDQARLANDAPGIVANLLAIDKIFDRDLPANATFRAVLLEKFVALAKNPAVASAPGITF